jgi:hypothetical protein
MRGSVMFNALDCFLNKRLLTREMQVVVISPADRWASPLRA